jgi:hypothetical protein
MMKVFYYYYYLLYKKSALDGEPQFTAKLALTASEAFFFIAVLDTGLAYFFSILLSKYVMIAITLILLGLNMFVFFTDKKVKVILESKPKFFQSHVLSIILTWLFFLLTTSTLFWVGDLANKIISTAVGGR